MKEELISFETAKLAKEKGFNIYSKEGYCKDGGVRDFGGYKDYYVTKTIEHNNSELPYKENSPFYPKTWVCVAVSQSLLQKWLRDVHNIVVTIEHWTNQPVDDELWKDCYDYNFQQSHHGTTPHKTYEEALEIGLQEALKTISITGESPEN